MMRFAKTKTILLALAVLPTALILACGASTQVSELQNSRIGYGIVGGSLLVDGEIRTASISDSDEQHVINGLGKFGACCRDDYSSPVWSPDGSRIVFAYEHEIYTVNADGSGLRRLTNNVVDDISPTWSPDGTRIAFVSGRGNTDYVPTPGFIQNVRDRDIYIMDADGSNVERITNNLVYDGLPAWSPDGSRIAFVSSRGAEEDGIYLRRFNSIYTMNVDGSDAQQLAWANFDSMPVWSPNGEYIAFVDLAVYVMDADGSNERRVNGQIAGSLKSSFIEGVSWSPDSTHVAYSHVGIEDIYISKIFGGANSQKIADGVEPAWSPDGSRIAFVSPRRVENIGLFDIIFGNADSEIHTVNVDGSDMQQITFNIVEEFAPVWLPSTETADG